MADVEISLEIDPDRAQAQLDAFRADLEEAEDEAEEARRRARRERPPPEERPRGRGRGVIGGLSLVAVAIITAQIIDQVNEALAIKLEDFGLTGLAETVREQGVVLDQALKTIPRLKGGIRAITEIVEPFQRAGLADEIDPLEIIRRFVAGEERKATANRRVQGVKIVAVGDYVASVLNSPNPKDMVTRMVE